MKWRSRAAAFIASDALVILVLTLCAAAIFFLYQPLRRPLSGDLAVFANTSRLFANGQPPYQAVFEIKNALSFLMGGAAIRIGAVFGVPDLLGLRALSFIVGILCVLVTYGVARNVLTGRWAAFSAAMVYLGFGGFAQLTATGLEPKLVVSLFGLAALWFSARRQVFWAGLCAACAGLAWQIGGGYVLVVAIVEYCAADTVPRRKRLVWLGAGAASVLAAYLLYFFWANVWREMFVETFWLPLVMGRTDPWWDFSERITRMATRFQVGYRNEILFALLGLVGWVMYLAGISRAKDWGRILRDPKISGPLMAFVFFILYSLFDFQSWPDWIPLLPFLSIWSVWLIWAVYEKFAARLNGPTTVWLRTIVSAVIVVLALGDTVAFPPRVKSTWQAQAEFAQQLEQALAQEDRVWFMGRAEFLFFMQRPNVNRYLLFVYHLDAAIEQLEPRGFAGFLETLTRQAPQILMFGRLHRRSWANAANYDAFAKWLVRAYIPAQSCNLSPQTQIYLRKPADKWLSAIPCFTPK